MGGAHQLAFAFPHVHALRMTEQRRNEANQGADSEDGAEHGSVADDLARGLGLLGRAARRAARELVPRELAGLKTAAGTAVDGLRVVATEAASEVVKRADPAVLREVGKELETAGRDLVGQLDRQKLERVAAETEKAARAAFARAMDAVGVPSSRAPASSEGTESETASDDDASVPKQRVRVD